MNKSIFRMRLAVVAGAISSLSLFSGYAAETSAGPVEATPPQPVVATQVQSAAPGVAATESVTATAPVRLPYGVEDVLKLSRAQVSEEITLNYIQNSGTIYNLGANDIVYLRSQGVSDRVINAMLGQRQRAEMAAQAAQAAAAASAPASTDQSAASTSTYAQAPDQAQPAASASSVYVIPSAPSSYPYYGYYPSYGYYYPPYPYYGYGGYYYGGPIVSFGFGFGGHGHGFVGHGFGGHGFAGHGSGGHGGHH